MAALTIQLVCDTAQASADIELLAKASERSAELGQRLLDLGDLCTHLVCVDADHTPALAAGQFGIRLQFSDALLELVAAVRAGDFDDLAV